MEERVKTLESEGKMRDEKYHELEKKRRCQNIEAEQKCNHIRHVEQVRRKGLSKGAISQLE